MGRLLLCLVGPVLQILTRLNRFILTIGENAGGGLLGALESIPAVAGPSQDTHSLTQRGN